MTWWRQQKNSIRLSTAWVYSIEQFRISPCFPLRFSYYKDVKRKPSSTRKSEPQRKSKPDGRSKAKATGNYIDTFAKQMFGRVLVFVDFLLHYADKKFVAEIDTERIQLAPTHYIGAKGDERIVDLVFRCRTPDVCRLKYQVGGRRFDNNV